MDEDVIKELRSRNIILQDRIGEGGFKKVYKALVNGKIEALKITQLLDSSISDEEEKRNYQLKMLLRSKREFEILREVGGENLVALGSVGETEAVIAGMPYYFYSEEYLEGHTLSIPQKEGDFPSWESIKELFDTGVKVLKRLNANNTIHRDIKPQNIMELSDPCRRFVFFDLGIAYQEDDSSITSTGDIAPGTRLYRAPETFYPDYKDNLDIRSDLYSLAVTVFVYATGKHPYVDDFCNNVSNQIITNPVKNIMVYRSDIPPEFSTILSYCLKKQPALRPTLTKIENLLTRVR